MLERNEHLLTLICAEIAERESKIRMMKAELVGLKAALANHVPAETKLSTPQLTASWRSTRRRTSETQTELFELLTRLDLDPERFGRWQFTVDQKAVDEGVEDGVLDQADVDAAMPIGQATLTYRMKE
jgi:hypothetical protein